MQYCPEDSSQSIERVRDQLTQAAAPARELLVCSCVSGDLSPYIVSTSRQSSDSND